ncbi:MAG: hypothetical protein QHI48_08440 [Bacteroidota bacterium]|nr:hypothetical protein [Bacteroidota bacterium]
MKILRPFFLAIIGVLMIFGCGKKTETVSIPQWETYTDPYYRISFRYPKGWIVNAEGGIVKVYSSQEAAEKFFDPYSTKKDGVEIVVGKVKMDTLKTLSGYTEEFKAEKSNAGFRILASEPRKLADFDGMLIQYVGAYTKENKVTTTRVTAFDDSMMYYAQYSAFNKLFEPYRIVLDTLLASVRLPKAHAEKGIDPTLPSEEIDVFDNYALKISYPANFDVSTPRPKGEAKFSLEVKGIRQDCTIRLDLFPSKNLPVEKVFEQNEKFYKAVSKGQTTIDGQKALFLNYSPAKNVSSRAYFVVKGDKMMRAIINYYTPLRAVFLPAFEKSVESIRIK